MFYKSRFCNGKFINQKFENEKTHAKLLVQEQEPFSQDQRQGKTLEFKAKVKAKIVVLECTQGQRYLERTARQVRHRKMLLNSTPIIPQASAFACGSIVIFET